MEIHPHLPNHSRCRLNHDPIRQLERSHNLSHSGRRPTADQLHRQSLITSPKHCLANKASEDVLHHYVAINSKPRILEREVLESERDASLLHRWWRRQSLRETCLLPS
ncbi:hypothetical protein QJS04_geneDACA007863 [Acorus gramineus]|uniref:Uncharacterized protein n=1 Tax=Acorus gramineus TaxID=55184 RepID=A0AAV9BDP3_ACOGR|nr:hypothetical protein QJS04_geneDACA007863 [Acorus gramineus]